MRNARLRGGAGRAAAAAVLLSSVVGCSSGRPSAQHPPVTSGATTSTTAAAPVTTTTEPAPAYLPSPYSWDRSTSAALAIGGGASSRLAAVLAPDASNPWTVIGTRYDNSDRPTATEWTSDDGTHWTSSTLPGQSGLASALAVTRYRDATIVVGSVGAGANSQAAVWISQAAGEPFTAANVPLSDGASSMDLVAAGPLGMFACGQVDGRPAEWFSATGHDWSELSGAERAIGEAPGTRVESLQSIGNAVYAAGSVQAGPVSQAAVWASGDGLDWHRVTSAQTSFAGTSSRIIYSLSPLGTGVVAVGAVQVGGSWVPASWTSPNGNSWSPPSTDFAIPHAPSGETDPLGSSGGGVVRAVSPVESLDGPSRVVAAGGGPDWQEAWTSSDGLHWTSLSLPVAAAESRWWDAGAVAGSGRVTVVADTIAGQPYLLTGTGRTWSQPSADPRVFGPVRAEAIPVSLTSVGGVLELGVALVKRDQVAGAASVSDLTLSSRDAVAWKPTASPRLSLPAPRVALLREASGWTAVGPSVAGKSPTWTSTDGLHWTSADPIAAPSSPATGAGGTATSQGSTDGVRVEALCPAAATVGSAGSTTTDAATTATTAAPTARIGAVAVGSVASAGPEPGTTAPTGTTRSAAGWVRSASGSWTAATVSPGPLPGASDSMSGCVTTADGLVAYGVASGPAGAPVPQIWRSADGRTWTRSSPGDLTQAWPAPFISFATAGSRWLAVASPDVRSAPLASGPSLAAVGPAAGTSGAAAPGSTAGVSDGSEQLWLSLDSGGHWQEIDTSGAPWQATALAEIDLAVFAGDSSYGKQAAVVGTVDGRLTVWLGTPDRSAA